MKKMYKKPIIEATQLQPITIICASTTFGGGTDNLGGGTGGGETIGD